MFSTAPAGSYPLVPTRVTEVHISSLVSSLCLRAKRPLEDTRWRSSRCSAPRKKKRCHATATSGLHRSWWTMLHARRGNRARARLGASWMTLCLSAANVADSLLLSWLRQEAFSTDPELRERCRIGRSQHARRPAGCTGDCATVI